LDKLALSIDRKKGMNRLKIVVISFLLLSFVVGCSQTPKNSAASSPSTNQNAIKVQQIAPSKLEIKDTQAVSDRLEKLAASIPQVQSAHCVVFGNTAVVGINVLPELDRSRVGTVKYAVAEALSKDPYGVHAIVTADIDLDQRIRDIRDDIRGGRAITGFADQMADIIGRIMPQLPRDVGTKSQAPVPSDANQVGKPNL
jgi:YhcN/YlaJ family sporulation lipoprotein